MLGVNIGSGQRKFHSVGKTTWINVDTNPKWEPQLVADGANTNLPDGIYDYVVLHHVLEHFGCGEAGGVIKEAHRLLKPFGSLLVFVPDMAELTDMWKEGRLSHQVFMTNVYGAYMDNEADRHKWGYNGPLLKEFILTSAEWSGYHRFDWRPIEGADIAADRWILGIEAIK